VFDRHRLRVQAARWVSRPAYISLQRNYTTQHLDYLSSSVLRSTMSTVVSHKDCNTSIVMRTTCRHTAVNYTEIISITQSWTRHRPDIQPTS